MIGPTVVTGGSVPQLIFEFFEDATTDLAGMYSVRGIRGHVQYCRYRYVSGPERWMGPEVLIIQSASGVSA